MPPVYTLIADDDTKRVGSTLQALRGLQTGVLVASDGQQALNLIQRFGQPQLLIVDLGLATKDAFSVMNALRTANAPAEILAWTPGRDLASLATARLSTLHVRP